MTRTGFLVVLAVVLFQLAAVAQSDNLDAEKQRQKRLSTLVDQVLSDAASLKLGQWRFTLGGDNVLNEYPDEVLFANSTGGQLPYLSSASPFGFNGAYVYGRVGYRW